MVKTCTKCGIEKDLEEFAKQNSRRDGRMSHCRECRRATYINNRETVLAKRKEYVAKHKDEISKKHKTYYQIHQQEIREYRLANREKTKEREQIYRSINKDRISARAKKYRSDNLDRLCAYDQSYRKENRQKINERHNKYVKYTPHGYTYQLWKHLNHRTINGKHPKIHSKQACTYLRKGIRLEITKDQLAQFITDNWQKIADMRAAGETPSIDRIKSEGHYSLDNIRIITLKENCSLSAKATHAKLKSKSTSTWPQCLRPMLSY